MNTVPYSNARRDWRTEPGLVEFLTDDDPRLQPRQPRLSGRALRRRYVRKPGPMRSPRTITTRCQLERWQYVGGVLKPTRAVCGQQIRFGADDCGRHGRRQP